MKPNKTATASRCETLTRKLEKLVREHHEDIVRAYREAINAGRSRRTVVVVASREMLATRNFGTPLEDGGSLMVLEPETASTMVRRLHVEAADLLMKPVARGEIRVLAVDVAGLFVREVLPPSPEPAPPPRQGRRARCSKARRTSATSRRPPE